MIDVGMAKSLAEGKKSRLMLSSYRVVFVWSVRVWFIALIALTRIIVNRSQILLACRPLMAKLQGWRARHLSCHTCSPSSGQKVSPESP